MTFAVCLGKKHTAKHEHMTKGDVCRAPQGTQRRFAVCPDLKHAAHKQPPKKLNRHPPPSDTPPPLLSPCRLPPSPLHAGTLLPQIRNRPLLSCLLASSLPYLLSCLLTLGRAAPPLPPLPSALCSPLTGSEE